MKILAAGLLLLSFLSTVLGDVVRPDFGEWVVLGPLKVPAGADPFKYDPRPSFDRETFLEKREMDGQQEKMPLQAVDDGVSKLRTLPYGHQPIVVDFVSLYGHERIRNPSPHIVYAATTIKVEQQTYCYLLLGSSDGATVTLNGEVIFSDNQKHGLYTYDHAVPLQLAAGLNTLCLRIPRHGISWGFAAELRGSAEEAATAAADAQTIWQSLILESPVLSAGRELIFGIKGAPPGQIFDASIKALDGTLLLQRSRSDKLSWRVPESVPDGVYRLELDHQGAPLFELICIGEPKELLQRAVVRLQSSATPADPDTVILSARLKNLLAQYSEDMTGGRKWTWQRNALFALSEEKTSERTGSPAPGIHLHGVRSTIDQQVLGYRLFFPRTSSARVPLIVMMPTTASAKRPFIESVFINSQVEAERIAGIAQELGVAVLWSGYRNMPSGNPIEVSHLREVLADVTKRYPIDYERVSLLGVCSGAAMATYACVASPDSFSSVGFLNPMLGLGRVSPSGEEFSRSREFQGWLRQTSVVVPFLTIKNLPTLVLHDGGEPGHGDVQVAEELKKAAEKAGFPLELKFTRQTVSQHFFALRELMVWLASNRRAPGLDLTRVDLSKLPSAGSVQEALASPFTIVYGTMGNSEETGECKRITDELADSWARANFSSCLKMSDSDWIKGGRKEGNVVLIGNPKTNAAWPALVNTDRLKIESGKVTIDREQWKGDRISFQLVMPRADMPSQKVIVVGAENLKYASLATPNIPVEGWFRYAVWVKTDNSYRLIKAALADVAIGQPKG